MRIAHVSDAHNSILTKEGGALIKAIEREKPDIVCITGDLLDSRRTKVDRVVKFVEEVSKICSVYIVTGNHESRLKNYESEIEKTLSQHAIIVDKEEEYRGIKIQGIKDPAFWVKYGSKEEKFKVKEELDKLNKEGFRLLLSHRPEKFNIYVENGVDLVLTGHAHGGQIRLPFIGGVYAPCQGLFPKYDNGVYEDKNTKMVVSRGIGNNILPTRIFNRPELLIIELKTKNE